jgi:hypothetical protein
VDRVAGLPQVAGELADARSQAQRVVEQQDLSHARTLERVPDDPRPEPAAAASGMMTA